MAAVINLLDRPLYGATQAAALLQVRPATLMRWVNGYSRSGVHYPPVIREAPIRDDVLTWGEFVEARYLADLRADGASLQRLRKVIATLKERFDTRYPLAHHAPFMDGRDVVLAVQQENELPAGLSLVELVDGQTRLSMNARHHVDHIVWHNDIAAALRPAGLNSPIVLDPSRGFGMPSLEGRNIRTEVLAELYEAGETVPGIAEAYELTTEQVDAAIRWELTTARHSA